MREVVFGHLKAVSSPARRVFTRVKDGNWFDRALPFLERFPTAPFGEQRGVIKDFADPQSEDLWDRREERENTALRGFYLDYENLIEER